MIRPVAVEYPQHDPYVIALQIDEDRRDIVVASAPFNDKRRVGMIVELVLTRLNKTSRVLKDIL